MKNLFAETIEKYNNSDFNAFFHGEREITEFTSASCIVFGKEFGNIFIVATFLKKDGLPFVDETEIGYNQVKEFRREANKKCTEFVLFWIHLTNGEKITISIDIYAHSKGVGDFLSTFQILDDNKFRQEESKPKTDEVVINREETARQLMTKADLLYERELFKDAELVLKESEQLDLTNDDVSLSLAKVSARLGNQTLVESYINRCIKLNPSEEQKFKWEVAKAFAEANEFGLASNYASTCFEGEGEEYYFVYMHYLLQAERLEDSLQLIEENIETKPFLFAKFTDLDWIPIDKLQLLKKNESRITRFLIKEAIPKNSREVVKIVKDSQNIGESKVLKEWKEAKSQLEASDSLEEAIGFKEVFNNKNKQLCRTAIITLCHKNKEIYNRLNKYYKILPLTRVHFSAKNNKEVVENHELTFEKVKKILNGHDVDAATSLFRDNNKDLDSLWEGESKMGTLLFEKVNQLFHKKKWSKASELLSKLIAIFPRNESYKALKKVINKKAERRMIVSIGVIAAIFISVVGFSKYQEYKKEETAFLQMIQGDNYNGYFEEYFPGSSFYQTADDSLWNRIQSLKNKRTVWVRGLRLRKESNDEAEVVEKLNQYSKVTLLGEKSQLESTIWLRGKNVTDFWMKIKTEQDSIGWVFGGALKHEKKYADLMRLYKDFVPNGNYINEVREQLLLVKN